MSHDSTLEVLHAEEAARWRGCTLEKLHAGELHAGEAARWRGRTLERPHPNLPRIRLH